MNEETKERSWKQKVIHESRMYLIYTIFLVLFLSAFATYRRLLLREYDISYIPYGYSLIEALILAKIILLGQVLKIGNKFNDKPLAITSLYKSFVFSLFVLVFMVLEKFVTGFLRDKSFGAIFQELIGNGKDEILAKLLVMFFTFILFFAILEIGRVIGEDKMINLFLHGKNKGNDRSGHPG